MRERVRLCVLKKGEDEGWVRARVRFSHLDRWRPTLQHRDGSGNGARLGDFILRSTP